MRAAFQSAGDIRSVDLLSALVTLWREKASGSLRFSRSDPGATAGFDLAGGEIVAAFSSQPQFDVASILVRAGKLDPAALDRLREAEAGDATLAALDGGLISVGQWRWGQKIRSIEILSDLLAWLEGEYAFDVGSRPPPGDGAVPIPRLVLELFLRSRDRTLVEHYLGPSDLPLVRAEGFDEEFEMFGLTSDAGFVVRLIDGEASAEEIAERAPADEFAVLKLLAALTTLGLVHPLEAAPEPSPAAGRFEVGAEPEQVELETAELEGEPAAELEPEPETPAETEEAPTSKPPEEAEESLLAEPGVEPQAPEAEKEPPAVEQPHVPADLIPDSFESTRRPAHHEELVEHDFPVPAENAPPGHGRRSGSGALLAGLLVVLIAAVAGLLVLRSRGSSRDRFMASPKATPQENPVFPPAETAVPLPTHGSSMEPTLPPTRVSARPDATRPPTPVPTRFEPTKAPTYPKPTTPPTRVPPPTALPSPVPRPSSARLEPSRAEWLRRAEEDRKSLATRPRVRFAIQLELACELPTLEKAWNWDRPAGTMWLLQTPYRGRVCFRVLWGRFRSIAAARDAKARVPAFFTAPGNRPTVVSVR